MKKITIFLFLLLSAVVGAQAQIFERIGAEVTDLSELSASKRYVVQVVNYVSGNKGSEVNNACTDYLCWPGSGRIVKGTEEQLMQNQSHYLWTFTPQADVENGFKLSVNGGKFNSWNNTSESGFDPSTGNTAATYVLSSVEGGFKMQGLVNNNPGNYLNYNDGNGVWVAVGAERAMTVRIFNVTYITSVSELSNSAIYTLKTNRSAEANLQGYLMYHSECPDFLASNWGSGYPGYAFSKDDEAFHWAIYKSARTGNYYFYSVKGQKFVASSTDGGSKPVALSATPVNEVAIRQSSEAAVAAGYPFLFSTNQWALNTAQTNGAHGVVSWSGGYNVNGDPGNVYKISKVGDLTAEMQTAIETAVTAYEAVIYPVTKDDLSNSAIYTLKTGRDSEADQRGYLMYHTDCPDNVASNWGSGYPSYAFNKNDQAFHWAIYKSAETGKYYFYSVKGQKFIASSTDGGSKPVALSVIPANEVEIRASSATSIAAGYPFVFSTNSWALNTADVSDAHGVVSWEGGYSNLNDRGNIYKVTKVGDLTAEMQAVIADNVAFHEKALSVTYVCKVDGREYKTVTADKAANAGPSVTVPFATPLQYSVVNVNATDATATVEVACEPNLPFQVSENVDNAHWYTLDIHSNRNNSFLKYFAGDDINFRVQEGAIQPAQADNSYFWCFVGNLVDGFKVYNKAAGGEMTLGWAGSYFTLDTPAESRGDLFRLAVSKANTNGACLTLDGTNYLNYDVGNKQRIATYTDNDAGSTILFGDYNTLIINSADRYLGIPVGAVGSSKTVDEAFKAQLSEAVGAVKAGMTSENFLTLENLLKSIDVENTHEMVAGGLYRLQNYFRKDANGIGWSVAVSANAQNCERHSLDKSEVSLIWKFEDCSEDGVQKYKIYGLNNDAYICPVTIGGTATIGDYDAGERFRLESLGDAQFNVRGDNNMNIVVYGGGNIGGWNSNPKDSDGAWFIIPATDIEIALNAVDGKSYSTVYLPFDVEATGNTNAYYGKEVGGTGTEKTITMTGTPDNKVKALQGALLVNDAAETTAVLNIVADAVAPEVNLLKGSCTAVTQEAGTVYVFGNGSDGVGFYRNNGNLKANRAYVDGAEGMMLVMKFDGQTTGIIDGVQTEGAGEAPLYDLSGRRVVKAGKGVYIRNGKKIYVK